MSLTIDEKTNVSLYIVGTCLSFIIAFAIWIAGVASDAKEAKADVKDLKNFVVETHDDVIRIKEHFNIK